MDDIKTPRSKSLRFRLLALGVVVLFGFPAIYLPIVLLGSHVREQKIVSALSTCGATPSLSKTATLNLQPQGGMAGVEAHFLNSVSQARAQAFGTNDLFTESQCHHVTLTSYDPGRRIFTVFFDRSESQEDRAHVAATLRSSGLFDSVTVEP